jgi:hypothetical protein
VTDGVSSRASVRPSRHGAARAVNARLKQPVAQPHRDLEDHSRRQLLANAAMAAWPPHTRPLARGFHGAGISKSTSTAILLALHWRLTTTFAIPVAVFTEPYANRVHRSLTDGDRRQDASTIRRVGDDGLSRQIEQLVRFDRPRCTSRQSRESPSSVTCECRGRIPRIGQAPCHWTQRR